MTELYIDPKDIKAFQKRINALSKKIDDTAPVMKKISLFFDQWVQGNFRKEGDPAGGWAPFKFGGRITYNKNKERGSRKQVDSSAKLLQDTGNLRISFTPFATKRNAGIGSQVPYSRPHEEGKGVPKRRMLPTVNDVKGKVIEMLDMHIERAGTNA